MKNKLAKLKYSPNNFSIIEEGDHVICAISGKKIPLQDLSYWNVELQEAYFSPIEVNKKFKLLSPPIKIQKKNVNKAIKFVKMGNVRKAEKIIKPAIDYLIKVNCKKIILGCTELPIAIFAFKSFKKAKKSKIFIDPNLILANTCVNKYKAA